ncbi:2-isopropylmalate synthase [Methanobrevibacter cuticularis]|uniref:2-isopropylmalate synthase n=1 Tax=Methanobrevibacter cuticularis TaxID=47311 RepID=A0A166CSP3_9EURY|nr:2-isopropylmalate synthase [Methanobrevibacter cuticularis]KZX16507.1 2-isopropylmalate synthase [Methanobrevibacter cuticularis]
MEANNLEKSKKHMNLPDSVKIFDTTLRDGEQAPGVALTVDEKIQIAQKLDNLGVNTIEFGFPAVSVGERESARLINDLGLNANLCGLARVLKNDIDALLDCDLSYVHTFIGTSSLHRDFKLKMSKEEVIDKAVTAIEYAKDHGITVEFSAEDSTRTEEDYLIEVYKAAESAGADLINVPDTVGVLVPTTAKLLISKLKNELKVPISIHFHNDFGLAVANSLMGIEAGAEQAHVTVNGIGERGGNASLEELVVTLKIAYGIDLDIDTTQLFNLSEYVSRITGIKMPPTKPIVGENAFAHESGIHVHGVLENAATYEPIPPELVGHKRKIALGKHTGASALKAKLEEYDIELNQDQFDSVYHQVKGLGDKGKCITDADLKAIAVTVLGKAKEESIKLLGLSVMTGESVSATATVKLMINGKVKETSSIGVGPVDAALNAIQDLVKDTTNIDLEEYNIDAITGGTDALAEVFVITSDEDANKATGRSTREDVIMASVDAVLNSINKILMIKEAQ